MLDVLRSGWLSTGEVTAAFEREFAEYVGARHAVALTNCTAALHLSLTALGIGPGDEVLVPSLTFVATVNAVRYTGATPVFVDVESLDDWCVSPADLAAQCTPRTKALLPMHYAGFPCNMPAVLALARDRGLAVVEDAAHTPGSWLGERHVGTFGSFGCFSFFANKNLVTGEGGLLVTDDDALAERVRLLRSHGMTSLSWERHRGRAVAYDVVALGYNYRFDEIRAALGRVQLAKLPEHNRRRGELRRRYLAALGDVTGLTIPFAGREGRLSHHIFPVLLERGVDRAALMPGLREAGVQSSVHYPPAHLMGIHGGGAHRRLPWTEEIGARALTLPLHPRMTNGDVDFVAEQLRQRL